MKFRMSFKRLFLRVSLLKISHLEVLFFEILFSIFASLIVNLFVWVNRISIYWYWKIYSGVFEKMYVERIEIRTYGFASPEGTWKIVARVPVGCSYLFTSIYCFACSKIYFKLFVQFFFFVCWIVFITFIGSAFIDIETCS